MKKYISFSLLIISLLGTLTVSAKGTDPEESLAERQRFFKEMRDYKHCFLVRELKLTKEQQRSFFPIYDEMEDETNKLNDETKELERRIESASNVTDLEYEKAAEALFDLKINEGRIERQYFDKIKEVLTKKQLFQLKSAEKNFNRNLIIHQTRLRNRNRDTNKN